MTAVMAADGRGFCALGEWPVSAVGWHQYMTSMGGQIERRVGRARQLLVVALRTIDSIPAMGEEPQVVRALIPSITHTV